MTAPPFISCLNKWTVSWKACCVQSLPGLLAAMERSNHQWLAAKMVEICWPMNSYCYLCIPSLRSDSSTFGTHCLMAEAPLCSSRQRLAEVRINKVPKHPNKINIGAESNWSFNLPSNISWLFDEIWWNMAEQIKQFLARPDPPTTSLGYSQPSPAFASFVSAIRSKRLTAALGISILVPPPIEVNTAGIHSAPQALLHHPHGWKRMREVLQELVMPAPKTAALSADDPTCQIHWT